MAASPNWIEIVVGRTARFVIIALAILVTLAGCDKEPLIPFSEKTPPLILVPAAEAGIEDGRGRFRDVTQQAAPDLARIGMVTDALWTDVDGDGRADLVV
ncbi:MAG: VCBS repeat-containing protein, partial [SAR324 cluster bacterium]|nr:VCBS repeat-containing protein [SAR324 cluster bacterium]